jgi:hypothetical protein
MAALEGIAAHLRTVPAPHVALQLVNRRRLWPSHDVERDRLMRVAAEAADFEIEVASIDGIAERRRWLRGTAIAEPPLVPRVASKPVGLLAGSGCSLAYPASSHD